MILAEVAILTEAQRVVGSTRVLAVLARLLTAARMVTVATHALRVEGFVYVRALADFLILANALCYVIKVRVKALCLDHRAAQGQISVPRVPWRRVLLQFRADRHIL